MRWRVSTSGLAPSGLGWPIVEVGERTADDAEGLGWPASEPAAGDDAFAAGEPSDVSSPRATPAIEVEVSRKTSSPEVSRETTAPSNAFEAARANPAVKMAIAEAALAETAGWESTSGRLDEPADAIHVPDRGASGVERELPPEVPRETSPHETSGGGEPEAFLGNGPHPSSTDMVVDHDVPRETRTERTAEQPPEVPPTQGDRERAALADELPPTDDDTPLAQQVAVDARRRITLSGKMFPKPDQTRILTVANQKGGVGKTTTTVNVAAALAQAGLRVLVIDIDPQGNASTALGIDHHAEVSSIYDVLVDGMDIAEVVQECPDIPNLWCAPATIDLAGAEIELVSLVARETRMQRALRSYIDKAAARGEERLDYVLIDCPPSLGLLTVNAFVAAEEVFIPIQCEYYALEGLSQLLKNIQLIKTHLNPDLHVSTILLTMYDGRTRLSAQVADDVRSHFPEQVLRTTVPRSVRISEAPSHGQTVLTYDPSSSGALSYLEAAGELADRGSSTE
jgi:chromosome partitioning protein